MGFEYIDNFRGYARYNTVVDGKTVFINIAEEAVEDDLKEGLTAFKQLKLENIVNARLASDLLEQQIDKIGLPYNAIIIKTGDLA